MKSSAEPANAGPVTARFRGPCFWGRRVFSDDHDASSQLLPLND